MRGSAREGDASLLVDGIARLGLEARDAVGRLEAYLAELALWNRRRNLVAAEGDELVVNHVLDSLSGYPMIAALPHASVADVGSGAGFPGIPLALFLEDASFALIERSARRASFLRNVVTLLDLRDRVEVVERDLSEVDGRYPVVTFRAFRDLAAFAPALSARTSENGAIVAYKGRREVVDRELAALGHHFGVAEIYPVKVPFLNAQRNIVVIHPHRGRGTIRQGVRGAGSIPLSRQDRSDAPP